MFNNFFKFQTILFILSFVALQTQASSLALSLKQEAWTVLSYNKIPANKVSFSQGLLSVEVASSAGPIVYKLDQVQKISGFSVKGIFSGLKKVETTEFDEDSVLRIGLVATGSQTLDGPKKWFAADWVKKLFSLAPPGVGLDKIHFFNFTNRAELVGKSRLHPKSNLMVENIIENQPAQGPFELSKKIDLPITTAALWISIDGDETKSEFKLSISEINLELTP